MATAVKKSAAKKGGSKADTLKTHKANLAPKKGTAPAKKGAVKGAAPKKSAPAKKEAAPKKAGKDLKVEKPPKEVKQLFAIPESPSIKVKEILAASMPSEQEVATAGIQQTAGELVHIPVASVITRQNFNKRKEWGDIEGLANSLNEYGQVEPIKVDAYKDGERIVYILTNGERRLKAKLHLIGLGGDVAAKHATVLAVVNQREATDLDRLVMQSLSNSGKSFEPLEEAELFQELRDRFKLQPIDIAKKTGNSIARVEQLLLLADNTAEVKEAVREKKISGTAVIELSRNEKDKDKRASIVKKTIEGGGKLKVKDVKAGSAAAGGGTKASAPAKKTDPKAKDLVDELIVLIKGADKANKDEKVRAMLFDIEQKARAVKKVL